MTPCPAPGLYQKTQSEHHTRKSPAHLSSLFPGPCALEQVHLCSRLLPLPSQGCGQNMQPRACSRDSPGKPALTSSPAGTLTSAAVSWATSQLPLCELELHPLIHSFIQQELNKARSLPVGTEFMKQQHRACQVAQVCSRGSQDSPGDLPPQDGMTQRPRGREQGRERAIHIGEEKHPARGHCKWHPFPPRGCSPGRWPARARRPARPPRLGVPLTQVLTEPFWLLGEVRKVVPEAPKEIQAGNDGGHGSGGVRGGHILERCVCGSV